MVKHLNGKNNYFTCLMLMKILNVDKKTANSIIILKNAQIFKMEEDVFNIMVNVLNAHISHPPPIVPELMNVHGLMEFAEIFCNYFDKYF